MVGQSDVDPIMTPTKGAGVVGVLLVDTNLFKHTQRLASLATQAKKGAKRQGGNTYYLVDSRKLPPEP